MNINGQIEKKKKKKNCRAKLKNKIGVKFIFYFFKKKNGGNFWGLGGLTSM
jgi:hypothetical protein